MRLPDFLLVGAQRAGTSFTHQVLVQHPEIFLAPGEVHFFTERLGGADYVYSDEAHAKHDGLSVDLAVYSKFFRGATSEQVLGEKSPTYMFMPTAARMIRHHLPGVKLIFLVRDPVARAYSHYWHEVSKGREHLSFENALAAEPSRIAGGHWALRNYSYVSRGMYSEQIERFAGLFRAEQLFVIDSADLYKNPNLLFSRILTFLGVDPTIRLQWDVARHHMPMPLSIRAHRLGTRIKQSVGTKSRLGQSISLFQRSFLVRGRPYPPMKEETGARLREQFSSDSSRLSVFLGKEPSWLAV